MVLLELLGIVGYWLVLVGIESELYLYIPSCSPWKVLTSGALKYIGEGGGEQQQPDGNRAQQHVLMDLQPHTTAQACPGKGKLNSFKEVK